MVFGHIDILVNNAGIYYETEWQNELDVNIVSKHYGIKR